MSNRLSAWPFLRFPHKIRQPLRKFYTSETSASTHPSQSRIVRFNRRLPKFLHKYTNALATAPISHITSFIILHEITAIVPLFGLAATFHYTHWLPPWFAEGTLVLNGVERFGKYFRKKGWIRKDELGEAEKEVEIRRRDKAWNIGEGGVRIVVEFATAYAVTKVLLPLRVIASVWATPWFATKAVIPMMQRVKKIFRRGKTKAEIPPVNVPGPTGARARHAGNKP